MVKFWIEKVKDDMVVCSNLHDLDLTGLTVIELVRLSLRKWEFMLEAVEREPWLEDYLDCGSFATCALCQRFYPGSNYCEGCPIEMLGASGCTDTPYDDYRTYGAAPWVIQGEIEFLHKVLKMLEQEAKDGV